MNINKHNKKTSLFSRLASRTLLAVMLMFAITVSAYAAITHMLDVSVKDVTAATYSVEITDSGSGDAVGTPYVCTSTADNMHSFTLSANGSASTGYCILTIDGVQYPTTQINKGESITISVQAEENTQIEFSSSWGKSEFYKNSDFDNLIENGETIVITKPVFNPFKGLKISVMGDSISTYTGWSDAYPITSEEYANRYGEAYYGPVGGDFHNTELLVTDTWWHQAATELEAEILMVNSGNSTGLFYASYPANAAWDQYLKDMLAWKTRAYYLGKDGENPDIIALYIGSNEVARGKAGGFGSINDINFDTLIIANEDGTFTYAEPATVAESYAILLHKVKVTYPEAEIYCFKPVPSAGGYLSTVNTRMKIAISFNEMLDGVAEYYDAIIVDLPAEFNLDPDGDGLVVQEDFDEFQTCYNNDPHPNAKGFDVITRRFVKAVKENSKYN